ncbi:hypothetical protein PDQ32_19620 [Bacillus cereus]|nr:hypothetical protein [Bacillus cereus]
MNIEVGKFYATDHMEGDIKETNIILVLPNKENTPDFQIRTETMYLVNDEVNSLYENNWIPQCLKREATEKEIQVFQQQRNDLGDLQSYSAVVSGGE